MSAEPTPAEVCARLLGYPRRMDGMHSADFTQPPSPISGRFETQAPIDVPWILRGVAGGLRRRLVGACLARHQASRALPPASLACFEALRLLVCPREAGEHRLGELGLAPRPRNPTAFGGPSVQASMSGRFRDLTGIDLELRQVREARAQRGVAEQSS